MEAFLNFATLGISLLSLGIGMLLAWLLYSRSHLPTKRLKQALFVLRTLAISSLLFLVFAPLYRLLRFELEKPIVVIGLDNSASITHFADPAFDIQKFKRELQALTVELSKKYEVKTYQFARQVRSGLELPEDGSATDIGKFLHTIQSNYQGLNLGAIVLASDGQFNQGINPLNITNELKVPIFPIMLGDSSLRKDLAILKVDFPSQVLANQIFTLQVNLEALGAQGEETWLEVKNDGQLIYTHRLGITNNGEKFLQNIPLSFKEAGFKNLSISWRPIKGEVTTNNNQFNLHIEVVESANSILILAASPHPDVAALKSILQKSAMFKVSAMEISEFSDAVTPRYDLVILHQLPNEMSRSSRAIELFNSKNTPLWFIVGAQTSIAAFNNIQNSIQILNAGLGIKEVLAIQNRSFTGFKTHSTTPWHKMPPLFQLQGRYKINSPTQIYFNQQSNVDGSQQPLWFVTPFKYYNHAYLLGEGLWKWNLTWNQLNEGDVRSTKIQTAAQSKVEQRLNPLEEFVNQAVLSLLNQDKNNRLRIYHTTAQIDVNTNQNLYAEFYNESNQLDNRGELKLILENERGQRTNYIFRPEGESYALTLPLLPKGLYNYQASITNNSQTFQKSGVFQVVDSQLEWLYPRMNKELLQNMAIQSGGKTFQSNQLNQVATELDKVEFLQNVSYERLTYLDLINFKWLFFVVLSLLSLEWYLRKRNGEI